MIRILLSLVFAMSLTSNCEAEAYIEKVFADDPRTVSVLIETPTNRGSGVVINASNSLYLVTARHVLFSEDLPYRLRAQRCLVTAYTIGTSNRSEQLHFSIDLLHLYANDDVKFSTNHDVAMVRIEAKVGDGSPAVYNLEGVRFLQTNMNIVAFNTENYRKYSDVQLGQDVFLVGFPLSLTERMAGILDPTIPMIRRGVVSQINDVCTNIIVDSAVYKGNSGRPVLYLDHPAFGVNRLQLIGIATAYLFSEEEVESTNKISGVVKVNSGYSIVEPIDIALDMAWK
jgi:S1-C subfamily serine protease